MEEKNNVQPSVPPVQAKTAPLKVSKGSGKKFITALLIAILGILFLAIVFIIIYFAGGEAALSNFFQGLGIGPDALRKAVISVMNVILGFTAFIFFILLLIGIFRSVTAPKDDKKAKSKGFMLTILSILMVLASGGGLFFSAVYLNAPKQEEVVSGIITEPIVVTGLTAPVVVKFDASRLSVDEQYQPILYEWDFDDSTNRQTGKVVTHTFKKKLDGLFEIVLTITLKNRKTEELLKMQQKHEVTITNEKVQASFTPTPEKGKAPLEVEFDASLSSDPDGEIIAYEWDFNDDGDFTDASGDKVKHTFDQIGKYKVTLRVTDNNQEFATDQKEVDVNEGDEPKPKIAILDVEDLKLPLAKDKTYTFDASESYSPVGTITKYEWDFGDGSKPVLTRMANHMFEKEGIYEVTLKVFDEKELEGKTVLKVQVGPATSSPKAVIETTPRELTGTVPFRVSFDGSKSTDPNNDIVDYEWDFDADSTFDDLGKTVSYTYNKAGDYTAVLRITDAAKNQGTSEVKIKVSAQTIQARVSANPTQGEAPLTVAFDASASSYPDGQIVSYKWDFGDGSPARLDIAKITYRYTTIGNFEAKVTAISSDGKESIANIPVTVRPVSVTACFNPTVESGPAPLTVTFDPQCSRGSILQYSWDFAGLDTTRNRKPTFTFEQPGDYTVTLEVSDNQNIVDTFNKVIKVTD